MSLKDGAVRKHGVRLHVGPRRIYFNHSAVFIANGRVCNGNMESVQQLRIFNDGLGLCSGGVSAVCMGQDYFLAFMLHNGRFVFTTTRPNRPDCTHGPVSGLTAATLRPCQRPFYSFSSLIIGPFTGGFCSQPVNQSQLAR